jgi:hypothetical protein
MEFFSKGVLAFLNTLEVNLPYLLHDRTNRIIQSDPLGATHMIILHNNEFAILNRIAFTMVKQYIGKPDIKCRASLIDPSNDTRGDFILSDYHMEFDLSEASLAYIKKLIGNQCISGKSYVFVIKNAQNNIHRNLYLELRRLIDINHSAKWILTTTTYAFMEKSLLSRAIIINCCFPLPKILKAIPLELSDTESQNLFFKSKGNVITFLELAFSNKYSLLWHNTFDVLLEKILKEKKEVVIIDCIRDFVYKLFHVGVSITDLSHYIVFKYGDMIQNIIGEVADCEYNGKHGKDCLAYEKLMLKLYQHLISKEKQNKKDIKCKSKVLIAK